MPCALQPGDRRPFPSFPLRIDWSTLVRANPPHAIVVELSQPILLNQSPSLADLAGEDSNASYVFVSGPSNSRAGEVCRCRDLKISARRKATGFGARSAAISKRLLLGDRPSHRIGEREPQLSSRRCRPVSEVRPSQSPQLRVREDCRSSRPSLAAGMACGADPRSQLLFGFESKYPQSRLDRWFGGL